MLGNTNVTIWNRYIDPATKLDVWKRTVLKNVEALKAKGSNIVKSGITEADALTVLISFNVDAGGKTYKKPKEWVKVPNVDMGNYFTLQAGDKIALGIIEYEIVAPNTMAKLEQTYDDVFTMTTVDSCDIGSPSFRHWTVGGK